MYSTDSIEMKTNYVHDYFQDETLQHGFSLYFCTNPPPCIRPEMLSFVVFGGSVSSTKQYFIYLNPNAFNSASDPSLLLLAVLVGSPLSLAVFFWVSAQSQSSPETLNSRAKSVVPVFETTCLRHQAKILHQRAMGWIANSDSKSTELQIDATQLAILARLINSIFYFAIHLLLGTTMKENLQCHIT